MGSVSAGRFTFPLIFCFKFLSASPRPPGRQTSVPTSMLQWLSCCLMHLINVIRESRTGCNGSHGFDFASTKYSKCIKSRKWVSVRLIHRTKWPSQRSAYTLTLCWRWFGLESLPQRLIFVRFILKSLWTTAWASELVPWAMVSTESLLLR